VACPMPPPAAVTMLTLVSGTRAPSPRWIGSA
jgi:hypothetical protein